MFFLFTVVFSFFFKFFYLIVLVFFFFLTTRAFRHFASKTQQRGNSLYLGSYGPQPTFPDLLLTLCWKKFSQISRNYLSK